MTGHGAPRPSAPAGAAALGPALVALGAVHLATATWAAVDHASFAEHLAPFGPPNGHLVDDYAAAAATFGGALLAAARVPAWRPPLIGSAAVWSALHAASHVAAAGHPDAGAVGPLEAALLVASVVALLVLLRLSGRAP